MKLMVLGLALGLAHLGHGLGGPLQMNPGFQVSGAEYK